MQKTRYVVTACYGIGLSLMSLLLSACERSYSGLSTNSDTTPPLIVLQGQAFVTIEVGHQYQDAGAKAFDDKEGDISSNIITHNFVNTEKTGLYFMVYQVTDGSGNPSFLITRTVEVVDSTPPQIKLLGKAIETLRVGQIYHDAGASALDNYDGDLTNKISIDGSVDTQQEGVYFIHYQVCDQAGNYSQSHTRRIEVISNKKARFSQ